MILSRKHLGMRRPVRKFYESVNEMIDYINAFNNLIPRGDGAKECAGSGSTLRACIELNRSCYGFEIKKNL